jgi:thiol-disulfide isomerase/thioredoxin
MKGVGTGLNKMLKRLNLNTERLLILGLLVVLVSLVVMYVRQNRENFGEEGKKCTINFFYVDWCPHCTKAKPEVEDLEKELEENDGKLNGVEVEVNKINPEESEENKEKATENNVNAYPTVVAVDENGNKIAEMNSAVTKENLKEFIAENSN